MEEEIRKLGRDFSERALRPKWEALDAADAVLRGEILREAANAGIFGFAVPETAGGSGLGTAQYTILIEEISRACAGIAALLAAHFAGIVPLLIADSGALLSRVTESERNGKPEIFIPAVREHASEEFIREDIETTVERRGETCVVTGIKVNVLGAGAANWFTVLAADREDGTLRWIAVPRDANGVDVRPEATRLGLRICPVNDVLFSGVEVSSKNLLANPVNPERLVDFHCFVDPVLAAVPIGVALEARDAAMKYSTERYQGGKTICDHDAVRMMLADMELAIRTSKALAYGPEAGFLASAFAADAAEKVCLDAVQVLGGYGYMRDYRIERMLRDAKTLQTMAGARARKMESVRAEIEKRR